MNKVMDYEAVYCTDRGIQKEVNQDSACVMIADTPVGPVCMAFLCDGMGGISLGEYASASVIETFIKWFENSLPERIFSRTELEKIAEEWVKILVELDVDFRQYGSERGIKLGTTATGMLFLGERYLLVQSGDSRAYEIARKVRQLSEDQSYVQQQVNLGVITEEEAKHHPKRNVLLNCIGGSRPSVPEWCIGRISKKANYLLCSDGFVHEMSIGELTHFFAPRTGYRTNALRENLEKMFSVIKQRGENDNITALVIQARYCRKDTAEREIYFHVRKKILMTEGETPVWQNIVTTEA